MKIKSKLAGGLTVLLVGAGLAVLPVASASAHNPHITKSCEAGVRVFGDSYDGNKTNTWSIDIGDEHHEGTFGNSVDVSYPLPQGGATTHVKASIADQDHTAAYSENLDTNVGPCGVLPPKDGVINPIVVHPATCLAPVTYDVVAQPEYVKYDLDPTTGIRPVVGDGQVLASGSLVISAHIRADQLRENGGDYNPASYTTTVVGGPPIHNASCVPGEKCTITGTPYHESDDNAFVLTPAGYSLRSKGNGHATGLLFPATGNLQGITNISFTTTNVVGNGIFFRAIVDLTADGGSAYNSLSIADTNTITQSSVATLGSKNVFYGKTIAQIADLYPDAHYTSLGWATGSNWAAGDGAVITAFAGDCGSGSFVSVVPETTTRVTDTNGETVCNVDTTVGGGSYNEVITHFTTAPVWNEETQKYDLVETTDEGYPQTVVHTTDPSLESCPKIASPVIPTVQAVCDADDTVTLATTANITYTLADKIVTATPADATVLAATDGWVIQDNGTAVHTVVFDDSACPVTITIDKSGHLALTGSDPTNLIFVAYLLLLAGLTIAGIQLVRRHNRNKAALQS